MRSPLTSITLTILILSLLLTGCSSITQAMRVEDRVMVDVRTMIDAVSAVPLVFVGERHDAAAHHTLQLEVIKGLQAKGKSVAIGMEMFEESSQKVLDGWSAGTVTTNEFVTVYQSNWRNIPYQFYGEIFSYARVNRIPIIALNAPREIVMKVSRQGLSSLNTADKRLLPPGAADEVGDDYVDFIRSSYWSHGRDSDNFRYICEAQMLRNRVMASRIRAYHHLHPDCVMVIIAGGGHVREKGGIPAELGTIPFKIIIPPIPGLTAASISTEDAQYLLEEPFSLLDLL
ncbi:MAG TPA: ChaN family lipoprotein [Desulfuromonadales bacterium]|nr:ChaN family lipoprotein [Desulfuromonadales bacterium]